MKKLATLALVTCASMGAPALASTLEVPNGFRVNEYGMKMPTFAAPGPECYDGKYGGSLVECSQIEQRTTGAFRVSDERFAIALERYNKTGSYDYLGDKRVPSPVPVPSSILMLFTALCAVGAMTRKRFRNV